MPFVLIRHKVTDFATWKAAYDDPATMRKDAGSMGGQVLRNADDPQEITILLEWDSIENGRAFAASTDLAGAMERAGVADQPDIFFLNENERSEF